MSVKKDPKRNTWYYVIDLPPIGGKRQQARRRGFKTKKEALAAEADVVSERSRGTYVRPSRTSVARFLLDEWLPAKVPTLKPSTAASYGQTIKSYVIPRIGNAELATVDGAMLNALYGDLLTRGRTGASGVTGGLSPKTVRNVHGMLHRAFKDAVRWRRLAINPADAADQPKDVGPEMRAWSANELGRFIVASSDDRLAGPWHLLATTGIRRGELLGLRWSDVDLTAKHVRIVQTMTMVGSRPEIGTPKTKAGRRGLALDDATAAALKAWRSTQAQERLLMGAGWRDEDDLVVTEPDGSRVHPQVLTRRFHAITKRANLRAIRLHDVRHSYATAALASGLRPDVLSKRLGHANVGVTLKVYAHVLPGDDEAAATSVAAFIGGGAASALEGLDLAVGPVP